MRELLATEPFLFGPGVYDAFGAQLVMYHGFKAVYFSGYSFAIGHLGTTDMDLYSSVEIADGARRTVAALRKFQLTLAVGDPDIGPGSETFLIRQDASQDSHIEGLPLGTIGGTVARTTLRLIHLADIVAVTTGA